MKTQKKNIRAYFQAEQIGPKDCSVLLRFLVAIQVEASVKNASLSFRIKTAREIELSTFVAKPCTIYSTDQFRRVGEIETSAL